MTDRELLALLEARYRAIATEHLEALADRLHREGWPDSQIDLVLADCIERNEQTIRDALDTSVRVMAAAGIQSVRSITFTDPERPRTLH